MAEVVLKVRPASADDLASLVILRCALWPHLDLDAHERILRERLDSSARFATMVLMDNAGQMCGFVELLCERPLDESTQVLLQSVFVTPRVRRCGGATQLLEAAQRWAHARGAASIYCDLAVEDAEARENLRLLGFAESESRIRATRAISAAFVAAIPAASGRLPAALIPDRPALSADDSEAASIVIEKARSPSTLIINLVLFVAALVAFANTDIFSRDLIRGMLLPLLDVAFVLYFLFVFAAMRYRKRADSSARIDQLFRADD